MSDSFEDTKDFILFIANILREKYYNKLQKEIETNNDILKTFTAFLLNPEKIIFYLGKYHLGIEYKGPERLDKIEESGEFEVQIFDYPKSENLLKDILGIEDDATVNFELPLMPFSEGLIIPTNKGLDKLIDLKWNFNAQDSIIGFNCPVMTPIKQQFSRIINSFFFDADENGLKTRHVKWLDLIPIECLKKDNGFEISIDLTIYDGLIKGDLNYIYPIPQDYKYSKLTRINRFVEVIGDKTNFEQSITNFLAHDDFQFILMMFFSAKTIKHQLKCEWQSEKKEDIIPDFFIERVNGFSDIVEFKLPILKNKLVVGKTNRESFSSELNSYISQTRKYQEYFEDPNNRIWFENKYQLKVRKPKRFLIVGRRGDFNNDEWKEIISDYQDVEIYTYDDIIDGVVVQFYLK